MLDTKQFWDKFTSTHNGTIDQYSDAKCTYVPGFKCIETSFEQQIVKKGSNVVIKIYYLPMDKEYEVVHLFEDPNNRGEYIENVLLRQILEGKYFTNTKATAYELEGYRAQTFIQKEIKSSFKEIIIKYDIID